MPSFAVHPDYLEDFAAFVLEAGLPIEVLPIYTGRGVDVLVQPGEKGQECGPGELFVHGRIGCAVARDMADRLGLPKKTIGRVLDELHIKIRDCELGCF